MRIPRLRKPTVLALLACCAPITAALLAPASHAAAQEQAQTQPRAERPRAYDRTMTVSPARAEDAAPPRERPPVLAFSQDSLHLRHENAATLYLTAFTQIPPGGGEVGEAFEQLAEATIEQLDIDAAQRVLEINYSGALQVSEPAVRRTWADWGAPLEEQGIATLLPYLNHSRMLASALAEEARVAARQGRHEEAAEMLRRMYVLAGHLGNARQPVLIDGLVGVGIARLATDRAAQIATLPEAPNRYWALTTLPTPMFDAGRWFRSERVFVMATFPALREPEQMTGRRFRETLRSLSQVGDAPLPPAGQPDSPLGEAAASFYITLQATELLKSRGYTMEQIEQMDIYPVVARIIVDDYYGRMDAFAKLLHLPFPEAHVRMQALEEELAAGQSDGSLGTLLSRLLMPSFVRAYEAPLRLERQIAALRIVEAIRDHAADHGGRLPASLEEVRLPIPQDPMTGRPFGYRVEGDTFSLVAERYNPGDASSGFTWRVTMRR